MDKHEMYCAGHLIEAGVAYFQATGKRKLLDVCIRMADHMMRQFGPEKAHWVPGHEEIELALVKLYQITLEDKYLDLLIGCWKSVGMATEVWVTRNMESCIITR